MENDKTTIIAPVPVDGLGGGGGARCPSPVRTPAAVRRIPARSMAAMARPPRIGPPSPSAFMQADAAMPEGPDIDRTGEAEIGFRLGILPRRRGANDMARVVLAHGRDPGVRALVREIVEAPAPETEMTPGRLAERRR